MAAGASVTVRCGSWTVVRDDGRASLLVLAWVGRRLLTVAVADRDAEEG